jgi:diguanylate cyclase (GGDEF)-like protein
MGASDLQPDELFELKLLFMRELGVEYKKARDAHECFCKNPQDRTAVTRLRNFFHRVAGTAPTAALPVLGYAASICERVALELDAGDYRRYDQAALAFADGLAAVASVLTLHPSQEERALPRRSLDLTGLSLPQVLGEGRELSRILVIDDDAYSARLIDDCLRSAGFVSSYCCESAEAMRQIQEDLPDLIVLDVVMPGIDGFELCRRVRQHPAMQFTPILFVTRKGDVEGRVRGLEVGGSDYIAKPFEPRELIARVRSHLTRLANLRELAIRDGLTRCFNHKYFRARLQQEVQRSQRYGHELALAMIDVDQFRTVNEQRGHAAGDAVLVQISNLMLAALRSTDVLARYGGEEFAVLLVQAGAAETDIVCRRLLERIKLHRFLVVDEAAPDEQVPLDLPVTISMGLTVLTGKDDVWSDMLERGIDRLAQAKQQGSGALVGDVAPPK